MASGFWKWLSSPSRKRRLDAIRAARSRRDAIRDLNDMERQLEELRDRAVGRERISCINDLYRIRSLRVMKGLL